MRSMKNNDQHQSTLRMRERGSTLDGYIFTDLDHARQWLRQPIIDQSKITVELVEVGEYHPCRMCGGTGHHQKVKVLGDRISAMEFLQNG